MPPPVISRAPESTPARIRPSTFWRWVSLICGPCMLPGVHGSPIGKFSMAAFSTARPSSYLLRGNRIRDGSTQLCPDITHAIMAAMGRAELKSASSSTTWADLPPSSSRVFLTVGAPAARIARPVAVDPVKVIMSTRGSADSAAPTSFELPTTTLKTPAGMSVSSATMRPSSVPDHGVSCAGLSTTVLPAISAGTVSATLR